MDEYITRLSAYRTGKSTIRFGLDEPVPFDLIRQIVKLRVKANRERTRARARAKR